MPHRNAAAARIASSTPSAVVTPESPDPPSIGSAPVANGVSRLIVAMSAGVVPMSQAVT